MYGPCAPGIDDSVVFKLYHNELIQLFEVLFIFLILLMTLVVDIGEEDTLGAIFLLVERVVPIFCLYQKVLNPTFVGAVVKQPPHVVAVFLGKILKISWRHKNTSCRAVIKDPFIYAGNIAVLRYVPMFRVPVSVLSTKIYCHFVQTLRLVLK